MHPRRVAAFVSLAIGVSFLVLVVSEVLTVRIQGAAWVIAERGAVWGLATRFLVAVTFLGVGASLLRPRTRGAAGEWREDAEPAPFPASSGSSRFASASADSTGPSGVRGRVRACMACGSADLRMLTLGDGLAAGGGELLRYVCGHCGSQGQPIVFDSAEDHAEFVAGLREAVPRRADPESESRGGSEG